MAPWDLWNFWLPAAGLMAVAAVLIALGLMRGARLREPEAPAERREMRVYADQMREIERDLGRGIVNADEAARLRTEIARRLLEADRTVRPRLSEGPAPARAAGFGLLILTLGVAGFIYWWAGAPLYRDQPLMQRHAEAALARAARPTQAALEAEWLASPQRRPSPEPDAQFAGLMEQLRAALEARPADLQGYRLLARNEAGLGNHAAAAAAQARVVTMQGAEVPLADRVMLAEYMVIAAGGVVSPEAEAVIEAILREDPRNGPARYYTGLMFAQTGRPDLTFALWRALLDESAPEAPWVPHIRATIEELALIAGVRYTLPPLQAQGARGPDAAQIETAADLPEAERTEMIGAMVEGLAARLAASGGSADDWARLIASLRVLGQTERARAIWAEAQLIFADRPEDLARIARAAGAGD